MSLVIFSVIGVLFAFLGLGVFLLSLISLLPVNVYHAIMSMTVLHKATSLMDRSIIPVTYVGFDITVALISMGLFYMITRKRKEIKDKMNGKTDINRRGTTPTGQISKHNMLNHHQHGLLNGYTYTFIALNTIWLIIGKHR